MAALAGTVLRSNDRREETTNYELSSKTVNTVSDGFAVQNLSVAVLVNRARIAGDKDNPAKPEDVDKKLAEIQQIVSTAAGFHISHPRLAAGVR